MPHKVREFHIDLFSAGDIQDAVDTAYTDDAGGVIGSFFSKGSVDKEYNRKFQLLALSLAIEGLESDIFKP